MSFDLVIQKSLIDTLKNDTQLNRIISNVYDYVPEKPTFPYISIGEDSLTELDTSSHDGASCALYIHTWSAQKGRKQTKAIQGHIRRILHRVELEHFNYSFHYCRWESSQSFIDADGVTRHGICLYNIFIQED